MTGSASKAMDVLSNAKASYQRRVQRGDGSRMTGSAYQAMDVLYIAIASYQRRVKRGDGSRIFTLLEAGG